MSDESSVIVTPLQPPFGGPVEVFHFANLKPLAVSIGDGELIREMLGTNLVGRCVILASIAGDDVRIRIGVEPS